MMKTLISLLFYLGLQVSLSGNFIEIIGSPNTDTYANYGDNFTLRVVAYDSLNNRPLYYTWQRNGSTLAAGSDGNLSISNFSPYHEGDYTVDIKATEGSMTLNFNVSVIGSSPPSVSNQIVYFNEDVGGSVYFDARSAIPDEGSYDISWYKDGNLLIDTGSGERRIDNIVASDAGTYEAKIVNSFGLGSQLFVLDVNGYPPRNYDLYDPGILQVGDHLDLYFYLSNEDANAVVTWYKNGQIFPVNSTQIVIENVNASNTGEYYAVITNDFGQSNTNTVNVVVTQSGNERDSFNDLGYYTPEQFENLRIGSTIIAPLDGVGTLNIQIEKSNDLNTWTSSGDDILTHQIPLSSDKQFFRLTLPNAE
tara:strand:+ start:173 stop:1264 length:1092 start_codon:yes stop_codon:yes gene_type:complete